MNSIFDWILRTWARTHPAFRAIFVLVLGYIAAILGRLLMGLFLKLFKADRLGEKLGLNEFFRKGGVNYSLVQFLSAAIFWVTILITLIIVSAVLDITVVTHLWLKTVEIIPSILAGILVLIIGLLIVNFFGKFVFTIARNAGTPNAGIISKAVRYGGILIVILISIDQIGLSGNILSEMLLIAFAAIMLGLALAFGFGCKDMARAAMDRIVRNLKERNRAEHPGDMEG